MNVYVGHIARRQAIMGGFAPEASPPPSSMILRMRMTMMVMTMMLLMIMIEMLALLMRCLLDTPPFVTRDKKGE